MVMVICAKCSVSISNHKETITCCECKQAYHPVCTRVESIENYKKFSAQRKSSWKCDSCVGEMSSNSSRRGSDSTAILQSIEGMRSDVTKQISQVNGNVEGIKNQLEGVLTTIGIMKETLGALVTDSEQLKVKYSEVKEENARIQEEMSVLRQHVRDLEQYSRKENLEIVGVPYRRDENVYELLEKMGKIVGSTFDRGWTSVAHRLPASSERKDPSIIVRFISRDCKTAFIRAARANRERLIAAGLRDGWPNTKIYVNDHLTPYNKSILGRTRQLIRERKIVSSWTRDCKVFVMKTANTRPVLLKTLEDIDQLQKD